MKFYKIKLSYIEKNINCILQYEAYVVFVKNNKWHNNKNAAFVWKNKTKHFYFEDIIYDNNFNKKSWRKFAKYLKLKAFL